MMKNTSRIVTLASLLAATQLLSACAPLLIGGAAVGGALMYTDRRTSGAQVEDEAIEAKSYNRIRQAIGDRGHVNVTSYNRLALLTGEVPSESDRAAVVNAVTGVENLRSVTNEIAVMPNSSLTSRSSDAIVTSKVKATLFDAKDVQGNAFKVVTERGTVYLMGVVTERELNRATELARSISGVDKVVRVAEVVSEEQLKALQPAPAPAASAAR
ncbi:BON domain-containing protein [Ideonella dechloratans]|uniref:BON domain-containing protein n=2 Tax=Ideonella dechloratans TaxID=36863 RepID=A0A643FFL6_IDEDE|nr:BON domain-containing protein [Ideonella dechloratans]KAB0584578.1 BON domain-containing protein [Ideonella dechloratans]